MRSFTTRQIEERTYRTVLAQLPPEAISVVMQVRRTLEIGDLAVSVLEHGQQTPGIAAVLSPRRARTYLAQLNEIWGVQHTLRDLVPIKLDRKQQYIVLVAGHRRHATCTDINEAVKRGDTKFTKKYKGLYRVELRYGLTVKEALALQFNENRHVQVPPHEEAQAAWRFWTWLSHHEPNMSLSSFAKIIGRSSSWVRNALRFCELPRSVQEYVDGSNGKTKLPYGILIEVARLADTYKEITGESLSEQTYHRWLQKAYLGQLDSTAFGRQVSEYLAEKRNEKAGQFTLFGASDDIVDSRPVRQIVAPKLIPDIWRFLEYFQTLTRLHRAGQLGPESFLGPERDPRVLSQYSPGSPIRLLARATELYEDLLPHLVDIAQREGGRHRRTLRKGQEVGAEVRGLIVALAAYESRAS